MAAKGKGVVAVVGAAAGFGLLMALTGKAKASDVATDKKGKGYRPSGPPPKQLMALAVKWAKTFGAPASLLTALMAIESSYNPRARNTNPRAMKGGGAWGLTQLLLTAAQDVTRRNPKTAKKYWPQWDGTGAGLLDPNTHLAIAAFKLASNWRRYKNKPNNWLTTGISWHQGTGGIDGQIKKGGGKLNPANLPPHGSEYYRRLQIQQSGNPAVSQMLALEQQRGDFRYV